MRPVYLSPEHVDLRHFTDHARRDRAELLAPIILFDSRGKVWIAPESTEDLAPAERWTMDGASIPPPFRPLVGDPFFGDFVRLGGLHDHGYQTGVRVTFPESILETVNIRTVPYAVLLELPRVTVPTDRAEVDRFCCLEALIADEAERWRVELVYRGVDWFGWFAWGGHVRRRASEFSARLAEHRGIA